MSNNNSNSKISVVEIFVNRVIERVQKEGKLPWQKPWNPLSESGAYNALCGRHYNGLNTLILDDGGYLTFKEIQDLGGKIKKGSHSYPVFFWKQIKVTETKTNDDGDSEEIDKLIPMLRYYSVFRVEDCEIPAEKMGKLKLEPAKNEEITHKNNYPLADNLMKYYLERENIQTGNENHAFYRPSTDYIGLPIKGAFPKLEEYFSTAFHEITHSTGASKRLNRFGVCGAHSFGSKEYSKEELVAELGACFLCSFSGVDISVTENNNVAYIQSWLNALKNDPKMLISAHSKARKAFDFIIDGFDSEVIEEGEGENPEPLTLDSNVQEWYRNEYPSDDLGENINAYMTFEDVKDSLPTGMFYEMIGDCDTVIRERVFKALADILSVGYGVVYDSWMDRKTIDEVLSIDSLQPSLF